MAITSIKTGSSFTNLQKYNDFLGPNSAYIPSSFESIATATPTSGSSITFSSIPSTYKHLQIRYSIITGAYNEIRLRLNGDTGSNYSSHVLWGRDNGSVGAEGYASAGSILIYSAFVEGTTNTFPNVGIIDVIDYASTTKNKTIRTFAGSENNNLINPRSMIQLTSGAWLSTSAANSVTIFTVPYATGTTISLYGIKG